MFKSKTTISGRLENSSGEWMYAQNGYCVPLGYSILLRGNYHYSEEYFVTSRLCHTLMGTECPVGYEQKF